MLHGYHNGIACILLPLLQLTPIASQQKQEVAVGHIYSPKH